VTERKPWRCPDCGAMVAPHVDVHWCDKPDGGVTAKRPAAPKSPFTTSSVTTTFPHSGGAGGGGGGTLVTMTGGTEYELAVPEPMMVTIAPTIAGRELFNAVQAEVLKFLTGRRPGAA
jgi:hypothetical protein